MRIITITRAIMKSVGDGVRPANVKPVLIASPAAISPVSGIIEEITTPTQK
jgi:hypothetical protein